MTATAPYTFRPYQERAIEAVRQARSNGKKAVVLSLATGTGKTVVAVEACRRMGVGRDGRVALWVAHQKELLQQAEAKFSSIIPGIQIGWEMGERVSAPFDQVVLATVQTLRGHRGVALLERIHNRLVGHVVDEAHRSPAASYRDLILMGKRCPHNMVMGLTATPNRPDKITLADLYDEIASSYDTREAIADGYLVRPRGLRIATATSIDGVPIHRGDFAEGQLARRIDVADRNRLIVQTWFEHTQNMRTLVFCAGIEHAHDLARTFAAAGVSARAVDGQMGTAERRAIFDAFRAAEILVLCGANLFVEGFDEPGVEAIYFARPTRSSIYYNQGLGRGLRPHDSVAMLLGDIDDRETRCRVIAQSVKPYAVIVDFVDAASTGIMTLASLFGPKLAGEHEALRKKPEKDTSLTEATTPLPAQELGGVGMREHEVAPGIVAVSVESFDLLAAETALKAAPGQLAWNSRSAGVRQLCLHPQRIGILPDGSQSERFADAYHAAALNKERNPLARAKRAEPSATEAWLNVTIEVIAVGDNTWEAIEFSRIDKQPPTRTLIGTRNTAKDALLLAERHVRDVHKRVVALCDISAPWRTLEPSFDQKEVFRKRGLPIPATRGEATDTMGRILSMRIINDEDRPKRRKTRPSKEAIAS